MRSIKSQLRDSFLVSIKNLVQKYKVKYIMFVVPLANFNFLIKN